MNNELLEYAKELKKRSESLIKAELENNEFNYRLSDWDKLIHPKKLIQLCDEVERINNLKPIGYMSLTGVENIHDCGSSTVHEESDDKRNIPVYIQY
ncbi:hypothetical protein [Providencia alcalifaciens]|uniref:hypothetical protein n=1 Tax=Providencia alcalifaciens TaxID=126385 RepID=UPI001CC6C17F|nr:hypothetical protein [Providencia alcalifaciens]CAG9416375.1 hypothetical protein NVI2019_PLFLNFOB_01390 [Providencia alcalifaciens]CAG9420639.1 hypothetical protein NVI2019_OHEONHNH_01931 [Providencia alcalifaciens]CAG9424646.1 hypothetical protein NVI2019_KOLGMIGM_02427 [Providencia alcalifaciens]CAG9425653.1 hypothetical protein NVI2019_OGMBKCAO_02427 [Providencia alcalifaciens]CAG9425936.1 hypothetical protein NVI2019_ANGEOOBF_02426 [Providencia alcalifaciens]